MRKKVIAGNWKMNMLPDETIKMIEELAPLVEGAQKWSNTLRAFYWLVLCSFDCSKYKYKNRSTKYALGGKWCIYRRGICKDA